MQTTPHLRLVKGSPAQPQTYEQRIAAILSNAKPTLPEHETLTTLKAIDSKLDELFVLLKQVGD